MTEDSTEVGLEGNEGTEAFRQEPSANEKINHGDHAWVLIASALVMLMTAPGLALFYSGLVRKKNVLATMMQCLVLLSLMSIIWAVIGYSLAFGSPGWVWGGFDYFLLQNVQPHWDPEVGQVIPMVGEIPRMTHLLFHGMFFVIAPALICGAFAERMRFSAMIFFSLGYGIFVYCPICHWFWGNGFLHYGVPHALLGGSLDFAGGTVVHLSSGTSALVCAMVLGKRLGFGQMAMPPHNLTYTALGASLLWFGWFGFNAGSAFRADVLASHAMLVTHLSASAGALTWVLFDFHYRRKPSILGTCTGAVAGLVSITPAAGYVLPLSAMAFGVCGTVACYWSCTWLKRQIGYDDSLDVFGVHGVAGLVGALLTGVFASQAVVGQAEPLGMIDDFAAGAWLVLAQLVSALIAMGFSVVVSYLLLKGLDLTVGLRVSQEEENRGLDVSQHGEEGYIMV
ncbi:Ammonium transporter [Planctomycetales bacterium 10988]|nr:Ammonium transporter [Planctomycetales bacterium 10988]